MPVKKLKTENLKLKTPKSKVTKSSGLSVPVYSLAGRASGSLSLPKEIFGQKVNQKLLAQAVRVYMTNQNQFTASTKTRGEVKMTTAKWYKQKGTGRARHGAQSAPIFVGGGVAFGPRPRRVRLNLPKKMKKAALISALSAKMVDSEVVGISGLEKATGKTKQMAKLAHSIWQHHGPLVTSMLIVTPEKIDNVVKAVRNIPKVNVLPVNLVNAYEVLRYQRLIVTKEVVDKLKGVVG